MTHENAFAALLAITLTSCVTIRAPEVGPIDHTPIPESRPVIGVLEPVPHLDSEQPLSDWGSLQTRDYEAELSSAAHLIALLRGSGLFREVDFVCQLVSPPELVVAVTANPRPSKPDEYSEAMFFSWLITVGLIPWIETRDYGTEFFFVNQTGDPILLEHLETSVAGWAALPMNLSSRWQSERDPDRRAKALVHVLLEREPSPLLPENWLNHSEAIRLTRHCS
jgi:hypothetical protein